MTKFWGFFCLIFSSSITRRETQCALLQKLLQWCYGPWHSRIFEFLIYAGFRASVFEFRSFKDGEGQEISPSDTSITSARLGGNIILILFSDFQKCLRNPVKLVKIQLKHVLQSSEVTAVLWKSSNQIHLWPQCRRVPVKIPRTTSYGTIGISHA